MRRLLLLSCAGLIITASVFAQERGQAVVRTAPAGGAIGDFHLLAVGIDDYLHWDPLKTAVADAQAVAEALQSEYAFAEGNVRLLLNAQATGSGIVAELRRLATTAKIEDSVLIFYAGHGILDSVTKEGAWVPVDGGKDDDSTWIGNAKVKAYLRAIPARHVLLISDSCFAGDFFRGQRGAPPAITDEYVRQAFGKTSRQAITSGGLEPVTDSGFAGHSVFTHFLLKELRENRSPYLLPSDLHNRIKGGVARNAPQQPILGELHDTGTEVGGEFVLFRKGLGGTMDALLEEKKAQLGLLEQRETEARRANAEQQKVLDEKAAALAALDVKIAAMQDKLKAGGGDASGGTLDQLYAIVQQKEGQARELEALRQKKIEEERQRQAEIERLRSKENAKRKAAFEADYAKFADIRDSAYAGMEVKQQAWTALCEKWIPAEAGIAPTDLFWDAAMGKPRSRKPGDRLTVDLGGGVDMEFVWVPPGEFMMGRPEGETDWSSHETQHRVTISKGFWMGKYEVTQEQWERVMGGNPSGFKGARNPVDNVSWNDCQEFLRKVKGSFRLPTEAEWEYACRAGTTGPFAGELDTMAWYAGNSGRTTHPVGQKAANAWGLYDMHGNVWEWCQDWYGDYSSGVATDPTGPSSGSARVLRGGSWGNFPAGCRSANRDLNVPAYAYDFNGFRVVCVR